MLEDETLNSTTVRQGSLFSKVLPDLSKNIVCGNSLIGTDILNEGLFSFEEEKKLNPMDFENAFPSIMKNGGFDAILGNPPYVMLQNLESRESFNYTSKNYQSAKYKIDTYQLFLERGVEKLKSNGLLGFIIPNTFLKNIHSEPLRRFLLSNTNVNELVVYNYSVFKGASVDTCTLSIKKGKESDNIVSIKSSNVPEDLKIFNTIEQTSFEKNDKLYFNISVKAADNEILKK